MAELKPDTTGDPTIVKLGNLRLHVIVRGERVGIRLKDLDSDAARQYHGPQFFPLDLSYRVTATWLPSDGKQTVDVPNVLGDVSPTPIAGTAVFKINGQELRLTDLGGDPTKGLFFVFSDPTSKTKTYRAAASCRLNQFPTAQWCSTSTARTIPHARSRPMPLVRSRPKKTG